MNLEDLRPGQIRQAAEGGVPVVLPVGVIEAHGHHLPVGCDAICAHETARRAAERVDLVVAPTVWYGPSGYDCGGPDMGSMEVPFDAFKSYAEAVLRSLVRLGFRRVIVLLQHQGTSGELYLACRAAARRLWSEVPRERLGEGWWARPDLESQPPEAQCPPIHVVTTAQGADPEKVGGDHAGYWETSFMFGFRPSGVDLGELARADQPRYVPVGRLTPDRVNPEKGAETVEAMVEGFVRLVKELSEASPARA